MKKSQPQLLDYALLIILAAIFGGSFILTKVAVNDIPAVSLVTIRLAIAAVLFFGAMLIAGQRMPAFGKIWWPIFGAALLGNVMPFFLIAWGQSKVDAGLAAILMASMPLMTIVIAHFVTRDEKLTPLKIVGFLLGAMGVIVMIGFDKLGTLGDAILRQYAIIGGALCYAISAIITRALVDLPRLSLMSALMVLSVALILPIGIFNGELSILVANAGTIPGKALWSALLLGIIPTALGTAMVLIIIARQGASFLSQINFMVPVFGVVWGVLFLAEILPGNALIALGLILTGVGLARLGTGTYSSTSQNHKEPSQ